MNKKKFCKKEEKLDENKRNEFIKSNMRYKKLNLPKNQKIQSKIERKGANERKIQLV